MYQPVHGRWEELMKLGGPVVSRAKHRLKYLIELSLNLFSLIAYTCMCWRSSRGHGGGWLGRLCSLL